MHGNEFINLPSACKTRAFQRQNPWVDWSNIKFWTKIYKIQRRERSITAIPSPSPQHKLPFQSSKVGRNLFSFSKVIMFD